MFFTKRIAQCAITVLLSSFSISIAHAESGNRTVAHTSSTSHMQFDGNNIACWMSNTGKIVDNDITGDCGMEWPKGSDKHIDYASGLWLIGKDQNGVLRSACAQYASEFVPGTINERKCSML